MTNEQFEELINRAILALPKNILEKMDNVEITMEEGESPNNSLFGLYRGVSQLKRGSSYGYGAVMPDKITIYKGTIEKFAVDPADIPFMVRRVVWHEIGHHFGFDEEGIRRLEQKWERENRV